MNYLSGRKKNLYYSRHLGNIIQHNLQGSTIYWVGLLELEKSQDWAVKQNQLRTWKYTCLELEFWNIQ